MKKYKMLTTKSDTHVFVHEAVGRIKVHRIQALRSFKIIDSNGVVRVINKGDVGGYINDTVILSHDDNSWIGDNAIVCGKSVIHKNSLILDNSIVCNANIENSIIKNNVKVNSHKYFISHSSSIIHSTIQDNAKVNIDNSKLSNTNISDNTVVGIHHSTLDKISVSDNAKIIGLDINLSGSSLNSDTYGEIRDRAIIRTDTTITDLSDIFGEAEISSSNISGTLVTIGGTARINNTIYPYNDANNNVIVIDNTYVAYDESITCGNIIGCANIQKASDLFVIKGLGPNNDTLTFYRSSNEKHPVYVTEQLASADNGPLSKYSKSVSNKYKMTPEHRKLYTSAFKLAKSRILLSNEEG